MLQRSGVSRPPALWRTAPPAPAATRLAPRGIAAVVVLGTAAAALLLLRSSEATVMGGVDSALRAAPPIQAIDAPLAAVQAAPRRVVSGDGSVAAAGAAPWTCSAPGACVADAGGGSAVASFATAHGAALALFVDADGVAPASGRRNAAYMTALAARPCAVWDTGADVVLALEGSDGGGLPEAATRALAPLPAPASAPIYLGVRPRGGAGSGSGAAGSGGGGGASRRWGALVNPLSLLAPSVYLWPRGYPPAKGEAERDGAGAGTPELVRLAAAAGGGGGGILGDDIVALHSVLAGAADAQGAGGGAVSYTSRLPLVLLAPGAVAPYGALSTLVRERGLWSLFLPPSVPPDAADVFRSLVSQAVFALCGLHVGFVPPWAKRAPAGAAGGDSAVSSACSAATRSVLPPLL